MICYKLIFSLILVHVWLSTAHPFEKRQAPPRLVYDERRAWQSQFQPQPQPQPSVPEFRHKSGPRGNSLGLEGERLTFQTAHNAPDYDSVEDESSAPQYALDENVFRGGSNDVVTRVGPTSFVHNYIGSFGLVHTPAAPTPSQSTPRQSSFSGNSERVQENTANSQGLRNYNQGSGSFRNENVQQNSANSQSSGNNSPISGYNTNANVQKNPTISQGLRVYNVNQQQNSAISGSNTNGNVQQNLANAQNLRIYNGNRQQNSVNSQNSGNNSPISGSNTNANVQQNPATSQGSRIYIGNRQQNSGNSQNSGNNSPISRFNTNGNVQQNPTNAQSLRIYNGNRQQNSANSQNSGNNSPISGSNANGNVQQNPADVQNLRNYNPVSNSFDNEDVRQNPVNSQNVGNKNPITDSLKNGIGQQNPASVQYVRNFNRVLESSEDEGVRQNPANFQNLRNNNPILENFNSEESIQQTPTNYQNLANNQQISQSPKNQNVPQTSSNFDNSQKFNSFSQFSGNDVRQNPTNGQTFENQNSRELPVSENDISDESEGGFQASNIFPHPKELVILTNDSSASNTLSGNLAPAQQNGLFNQEIHQSNSNEVQIPQNREQGRVAYQDSRPNLEEGTQTNFDTNIPQQPRSTYTPNSLTADNGVRNNNNNQQNPQILNQNKRNVAQQNYDTGVVFSTTNSNNQNQPAPKVAENTDVSSELNSNTNFNQVYGKEEPAGLSLEEDIVAPFPIRNGGQGFVVRVIPSFVMSNITSLNEIPMSVFDQPVFVRSEDILMANMGKKTFQGETVKPNENVIFQELRDENQSTSSANLDYLQELQRAQSLNNREASNQHPYNSQSSNNQLQKHPTIPRPSISSQSSFNFHNPKSVSSETETDSFEQGNGLRPSYFDHPLVQQESRLYSRGRSLNFDQSEERFAPGAAEGGFRPSNYFGRL